MAVSFKQRATSPCEVLDDPEAEKDDMIRVIDESGEDYLYPSGMFVFAPLPTAVEQAVIGAIEP